MLNKIISKQDVMFPAFKEVNTDWQSVLIPGLLGIELLNYYD